MSVDLTSCSAKMRRAEEHLEAIKDKIRAWHNTNPYRLVRQTDAKLTRHSIVAKFDRKPPIARLQLLAGDCAHAFRSALDHLVYAVAVFQSGIDPPPDERRLQFPIADTVKAFGDQAWRIKALSTAVRTEIESLQPYHRSNPYVPPFLSVLREFDDSDKHRLLNVIVSGQFEGELHNLTYPIPPKQSIEVYFHQGPIEEGTETFAVVTPTPHPDVSYDLALKLGIAIQHGIGPDGADHSEVAVLFSRIRDEVGFIIDRVVARA